LEDGDLPKATLIDDHCASASKLLIPRIFIIIRRV
jgi:hypothetical protein